jgi:hypothetical protein
MKKILWVVNPLDFRESDCEFPYYIAALIHGEVSVAFIDTGILENIPLLSDSAVFPTRDYRAWNTSMQIHEEKLLQAESIHSLIRGFFTARNRPVQFHENEGLDLEEIIKESRFSDLMLVNLSLSAFGNKDQQMSSLVKEMLSYCQCPVLITPDTMQEIQRVYFTYNGSYSSVYAIRQFCYLFENLKKVPITVLSVLESEREEEVPEKKRLIQYLSRHFKSWDFRILKGRPENELLIELMYHQNAIVTFGAFSRNRVSKMLHPSDSEKVTEGINIPVFITHP